MSDLERRKSLIRLFKTSSIEESVESIFNFISSEFESFKTKIEKLRDNVLSKIEFGDRDDPPKDYSIERIQRLLLDKGYFMPAGADGIFGKQTKRAVLAFQKNNQELNLTADGSVGQKTLAALEDFFSKEAPSSYRTTSGQTGSIQLYNDLYSVLKNKNLCIAMVANAKEESNLKPDIAGDCDDYGKKHADRAIDISGKGLCCSFGLWQFNICGGLGISLLKAYGVDVDNSTVEEKMEVLSSYDKQLEFMTAYVQRKIDISQEKSIAEWVKWFVEKVERPRHPVESTRKRTEVAMGIADLVGPKIAADKHSDSRFEKLYNINKLCLTKNLSKKSFS